MDTSHMGNIADELEDSLREAMNKRLGKQRAGNLQTSSFDKVLRTYLNWSERQVPPTPRAVEYAPSFVSTAKYNEHREVLAIIEKKIRVGESISAYLSRKNEKLREKDRLLGEWGFHHLHLSRTPTAPGTAGRTDDLLFVAFTPHRAAIIGIWPHKQWTRKVIAKTFIRAWPENGLFHRSKTIVGLERRVSAEDHASLRDAGITIILWIDGSAWLPPSLMTSGHSMRSIETAMAIERRIASVRKSVAKQPFWCSTQQVHHQGDVLGILDGATGEFQGVMAFKE